MKTTSTTIRKRGPVAGAKTEKYTVLLEPELAEWAKQRPGGLSEQLRQFLREAYAKEHSFEMTSDAPQPLSLAERRAFMRLPLAERRLAEQAEKLAPHYEQDPQWREWQGGDIIEHPPASDLS